MPLPGSNGPAPPFRRPAGSLRGSAEASPSLERLLDRLGFFLSLAGITALLVGGIGIGNAVAGYIASKTEAIATLKCLGASTGLVFAAYLLQILALALIGIAIGLMLGGAAPLACGTAARGIAAGLAAGRGVLGAARLRGAVRRSGDAGLCAVAAGRDRPRPARRAVARPDSAGAAPSGPAGGGRDGPRRPGAGRGDRAERAGAPLRAMVSRRRARRLRAVPPRRVGHRRRRPPRPETVSPADAAGTRQSAPSRRRRPRASSSRSASVSA